MDAKATGHERGALIQQRMTREYQVTLSSRVGLTQIVLSHIEGMHDADAGEAAKQLLASPHHWTVHWVQEQ